jgi:hypothetical protein
MEDLMKATISRISTRAKVFAGILGGALGVGVSVALAAWIFTGTGTGVINSYPIQNFTVSVGTIDGLYPGSSGSSYVTVSNPNRFIVDLTSATATSDSPCYTVSIDLPPSTIVPAQFLEQYYSGGFQYRWTDGTAGLTLNVSMPISAGPECAGASFTPSVTVNGQLGTA